MFHWCENMFFGRKQDGSVRILKFGSSMNATEWPKAEGHYPDAIFDVTIDQHSWCSIISSVSKRGEASLWEQAKDFHGIEASDA